MEVGADILSSSSSPDNTDESKTADRGKGWEYKRATRHVNGEHEGEGAGRQTHTEPWGGMCCKEVSGGWLKEGGGGKEKVYSTLWAANVLVFGYDSLR